MGAWNGVGGKIRDNETPLECIKREIHEETSICVEMDRIKEKGILTWERFEALGNGLYMFLVDLPDDFILETPMKVDEGILDFKPIEWIVDFNNEGIAKNIPHFLPTLLNEETNYHFHCVFGEKHLETVSKSLPNEELKL